MDAPGPMDTRYVPKGMDPERAYRWCLARTTRDLRQSVRRGRAISLPSLSRLFTRRWQNVLRRCCHEFDGELEEAGTRHGQMVIRHMYLQQQAFSSPGGRRRPMRRTSRSDHDRWD